MNHVAIDLGGRESQICVRQPDGAILEERKVPTRKLLDLVAIWPASRIVLETCSEAFRIADAAREQGHQVRVVPATLVRTLGVGARGVKTDRRDARVLSEVSCRIDLPSVHIPSMPSRELKSLCGSREVLVENRTKLINNVRGWLRAQLWRVRSGAPSTFPMRVRAHAATIGQELPAFMERQLVMLDHYNEEIRQADRQLEQIAKDTAACRRMMTVPGVGPVTAVRFFAALDEPTRFPTSHLLESYLGLTPGEHQSSMSGYRTGITKAGPSAVRRTLVQAAWTAFRMFPSEPMVRWALRLANRRGKFVAIVALARKIAGIMFALWRDGSTYHSSRSAEPTT